MSTLLFDIEGDHLLIECTRVWCIVTKDYHTKQVKKYRPHQIQDACKALSQADVVVCHNAYGYDVGVLRRLYGCTFKKIIDTLVMARLLFPDRFTSPVGGNSLAQWGRFLGHPKTQHHDWTRFSEQMLTYCENDVAVLQHIYDWLCARTDKSWRESLRLQHDVAAIILRQMQNGFTVDRTKVRALIDSTVPARAQIETSLRQSFPDVVQDMKTYEYWVTPGGLFNTKTQAKQAGYKQSDITPGPLRKRIIPFNPGSGPQIVGRLKEKYGWVPQKFKKDTGNAVVDGNVLESLPYPEAKLLVQYRTVNARAEEALKWLSFSQKDSKIHGSVNTIGAPTGRMSHSDPNINFPRVVKDKKTKMPVLGIAGGFGWECRSCFGPRAGWVEVGIDASSLQLRMLADRLWSYDNGAYARIALEGDIHTVNMHAAGLDSRDDSKTFFYAFCYGAGAQKLGSIKAPLASAQQQRRIGSKLKESFLAKIPAFKQLLDDIATQVTTRKYLLGLDGRKLPVRSAHAGLNTQLQSDGAVVMKKALVIFDTDLRLKYTPGQDYEFLANVHDEWQVQCKPEIAEQVGKTGVIAITKAGQYFKMKVPLTGEYKIGANWAECH